MPQTELDPFSLVYNGLWDLVERNPKLKDYVKSGNRIKYKKENEEKPSISDADTPELALMIGGGVPTSGNSTESGIVKVYVWGITTGTMELVDYNKISFELFRSLIDWCCVLSKLSWCNCPGFVKRMNIVSLEEGSDMIDLNRTIHGWSALWNCEVEMAFPTSILKI